MHILTLPYTFFLSNHRPNKGIFQSDLTKLLLENNHEVWIMALKLLFIIDEV